MSKNKKKKLKKRAKRHQPLMEEIQALGNQAVRDSSSSEDELERVVHQEQAKKSPNFIRTKDRHRITYVLAS